MRKRTPEPKLPAMPSFESACGADLITTLMTDHGRGKVVLAMRLGLAQTIDVMSVQTPDNPAWMQVFVDDFLAKYATESLDDFALFLQMFRRGELHAAGKPQLFGGRVDGEVMFRCWEIYLERKVQQREGMHEVRKSTAYADLRTAADANPAIRKLGEALRRENAEKKADEQRALFLRMEQHKGEGRLEIMKARSVAELRLLALQYPYHACRLDIENRCRELALDPIEVLGKTE